MVIFQDEYFNPGNDWIFRYMNFAWLGLKSSLAALPTGQVRVSTPITSSYLLAIFDIIHCSF